MQLNEDLFQRSTATRHHPSTDRNFDRLTWTHTAPMGFTGWSQRDTLTTGHGHCRDNQRQHTIEVERIVRSLAARGYRLHTFGAKVLRLARYADTVASSDSMAWSFRDRYVPGCTSSHRSESNCPRFALAWHDTLTRQLHTNQAARAHAVTTHHTSARPATTRPGTRDRSNSRPTRDPAHRCPSRHRLETR